MKKELFISFLLSSLHFIKNVSRVTLKTFDRSQRDLFLTAESLKLSRCFSVQDIYERIDRFSTTIFRNVVFHNSCGLHYRHEKFTD